MFQIITLTKPSTMIKILFYSEIIVSTSLSIWIQKEKIKIFTVFTPEDADAQGLMANPTYI
jgi:hypothetical protein